VTISEKKEIGILGLSVESFETKKKRKSSSFNCRCLIDLYFKLHEDEVSIERLAARNNILKTRKL
jgi:hypothetical protein